MLIRISFLAIISMYSLFFLSPLSPAFADYRTDSTVSTDIGHPTISNGSVPANSSTCGNNLSYIYDFNNNVIAGFGPKNFGDPACDFQPTKLADLITSLDPTNKYRWYNIIAWCESRYDPNVEELQGSVDIAHAWGLFQMGRGLNGSFDHGDVSWRQQTSNAINYNKTVISGSFLYWATRNYDPTTCT